MKSKTFIPPEQIEADNAIKALIKELNVEQYAFEKESKRRIDDIETGLELIKHNVAVAKHDLEVDMSQAMRMLAKAAKGIILPSDLQK